MAGIALNELKFRPDMYFYEFYQILEDFWKIFKIDRFLAAKRSFGAFFRVAILKVFQKSSGI